MPGIAIIASHSGLIPPRHSSQLQTTDLMGKYMMTSETRTTLTFLGAGFVAAAMALGADLSWADVIKALF
jgi:hypothetical protein